MKPVLGIDLGTTNSAMAIWNGSEPEIIPNDRGSRITPSVVAVHDSGEVLVGESAVNQAVVNARNTVYGVKRRMGTSDEYLLNGRRFTPEEVSACIVRKLRLDAEEYLGVDVHDAVITVPAYFSERQRRATIEAGRLAGLRVLRILNEPTAAALAYASRCDSERVILVYDLGGGTFDVTCLRQTGSDFQVLATAGDPALGGVDFTDLLLQSVRQGFAADAGIELADAVIVQQLREMVERGKIELSSRDSAEFGFPFIGSDGRPLHLHRGISRSEFNAMIHGQVDRSLALTRQALTHAGIAAREVDALVLSGGSSRIPLIRQLLQEEFGSRQVSQVNPDEIVAMGAALQASLLQDNRDMSLRDVTAFDLGVEIEQGRFVPLVKRNSPLPAAAERLFTTISDEQAAVEIHVLQGNQAVASGNSSLGRFLLDGIQRGRRGQPRIRIKFRVDADGLVHVGAIDQETGAEQEVTLSGAGDAAPELGRRSRVQSLVQRLERQVRAASEQLDPGFQREAREVCSLARRSMLQQDDEALDQIRGALETLLIEVQSFGGITNESFS
ncbi:Hsp70 family protein [Spirochaeta africana]|uniref:Molecular chaperone n=1 Tax=Spirochaeta africana (strain ATCC 700263 / DSM 8902 / Z-7692) TaxID=889378 RepID=H9UKT2_SPIAZ|nr:Hsp70 family protein [Spirochaeta africana]AFG38125.1 molecular chaperone [Spirochaeta africana DSM 8902]